MIIDEQQYQVTKDRVEQFARALAHAGQHNTNPDPILHKALLDGLASQLEELQEEIAIYEGRKTAKVSTSESMPATSGSERPGRIRESGDLPYLEFGDPTLLQMYLSRRLEALEHKLDEQAATMQQLQAQVQALHTGK